MPGGAAAIRKPYRMALGYLYTLLGKSQYGQNAAIIGEVREKHRGRVTMKTSFGTSRIVDMLVGEPLPRIC